MMYTVYDEILKKLREVSSVKFVGWDNGEIDLPAESYPVPFPSVFIDFTSYQPEEVGLKVQRGLMTVQLRVAFKIYDDMSSIAPETSQNAGFDILHILTNIFTKLQGFGSDNFSRLNRVSQNKENRQDDLSVYVMIFETDFRDSSAKDLTEEVEVTLEIKNTNE